MNSTQNFCENCGAPLEVGSRFCERCGTPVRVEPPPAAPNAPASPVPAVPPDPPATAHRFNWFAVLLPALFLVLLVAAVAAFWLFAPPRSDPDAAPAETAVLTAAPEAVIETADILPPMTGEVPVPLSAIPDAVQAAAPEHPVEDWFALQPWFQELAASMPAGVTLQLFVRSDEDLPGATTVEVRENRSPESGFDPDFSPLVGIFRVPPDRSEILYLDALESDYVPLEHFLTSRYSPEAVGVDPDMPVSAPPAETPEALLPPVEIVYRSFMDEAFRSRGGNLRVGSPYITDHRIDNTITVEGVTLGYVFVEIANDGQTAEVLVGPQDAGADRTYTLRHTETGWEITGYKEGEY